MFVFLEKNIFVIAFAFRILDFSDRCGVTVVYRAPCISLMVGQPFPGSRIGATACSGSVMDSATPMVSKVKA